MQVPTHDHGAVSKGRLRFSFQKSPTVPRQLRHGGPLAEVSSFHQPQLQFCHTLHSGGISSVPHIVEACPPLRTALRSQGWWRCFHVFVACGVRTTTSIRVDRGRRRTSNNIKDGVRLTKGKGRDAPHQRLPCSAVHVRPQLHS